MSGNDTRQSLASALVAGAVVLVVGWGSGLGTLLSGAVAAPAPVDVPAAPSAPETTSTAAGTVAGTALGGAATGGYLPVASGAGPTDGQGGHPTTAPSPHGAAPTSPASRAPSSEVPVPDPTSPGPGGGAGSCTSLLDAIVQPFIAHLVAGHLEESPAQQIADILNISQYVKTHTVLIETMLQPLYAVLPAVARSADAFVQHVYHGHLEESPAQQIADILNTDQYVKTHTVLVENMVTPIEQTGSGC